MMEQAKSELEAALERSLALQAVRERDGLDPAVESLESWQKRRLGHTYRDLSRDRRYRAATRFFTRELYAPPNLKARDEDLTRMVPFMVRLLPAGAVRTVADALNLQALTLDLDLAMTRILLDEGRIESLALNRYAQAYRSVGRAEDRQRQIELLLQVGRDLEQLVENPFIYTTLKICRTPARLAGLLDLHDFLVHGFDAFREMGGAGEFLARIQEREQQVMVGLFEDRMCAELDAFALAEDVV